MWEEERLDPPCQQGKRPSNVSSPRAFSIFHGSTGHYGRFSSTSSIQLLGIPLRNKYDSLHYHISSHPPSSSLSDSQNHIMMLASVCAFPTCFHRFSHKHLRNPLPRHHLVCCYCTDPSDHPRKTPSPRLFPLDTSSPQTLRTPVHPIARRYLDTRRE